MKRLFIVMRVLCGISFSAAVVSAEEQPIPQQWDYVPAMKKVAANFKGKTGVVLHIGDSITYSNPYGQWARYGQGKTPEDKAILGWMHCNAKNDTDGWWLAAFDHPAGGRSYTACSGISAEETLRGGKRRMPSLSQNLKKYKPQIVVLMLGTNDASAGRTLAAYRADMVKAVGLILGEGSICILSSIPPHFRREALVKSYNASLREIAKAKGLPLIDFEKEILKRRPNDWNGILLGRNDVHPTARQGATKATSPPTAENLKNSGYLLRGWLSVKKIAEVKKSVLDGIPLRVVAAAETKTAGLVAPVKAPTGEKIRVKVTRDTWFSNVGSEARTNLGGANRLKLKGIQEMSLVDIDPKPFKGRVINGATLHLRIRGKELLRRITVSTFAAEWVEGTSTDYKEQNGSSSHSARRYPNESWAYPGSDLCAVMLGQGGTIWRSADVAPKDAKGWYKIAVDPLVVAARIAGTSHGFLVFDDIGSEWTRNGEQFTYRIYPNRFVHSREAGANSAPYFTLFLGEKDSAPPEVPLDISPIVKNLPAGQARVSWLTPKDSGKAGTVGFFVEVNGKPIPRYLIPAAGKPGERVQMRLRDLELKPGEKIELAVRAVDGAGNSGQAGRLSFSVSGTVSSELPAGGSKAFSKAGPLPKLGQAEVAILDPLDKVHPVSGSMIPSQPEEYLSANHLWSAGAKRIRLYAARNEFVGFQILFKGTVREVSPTLKFDNADAPEVTFSRYRFVYSKKGPLPDPVVPLKKSFTVPTPEEKIEDQKTGSLLCEIYVPHSAALEKYPGTLTLSAGAQRLDIPVELNVWNFTLPDYLSFLPEMNCYSLPANERDYYRLAHRHRTVINRVPYSQSGNINRGCAPKWNGKQLDWSAWDKRYSQYFDGSAFADLPRKSVPLDCFYVPMHENWPSPMKGNYNENYWADRAFPKSYRDAFIKVSRQFKVHFNQNEWNETLFHCYLNNKVNYKRRGWSRGSSPWLLDEPANWHDYWALRYFGILFHEGVNQAGGKAKMVYRTDISRPQWERGALDGVEDYYVVNGGVFRRYRRMILDRKEQFGAINVDYGSSNAIESSNMQAAGWCLDSWTLESDGVLPWQTIGSSSSWQTADQLSIFYPGGPAGQQEPIPSIRLKAYRRGQQDVEYLTLWKQLSGEPQWAVGERVRAELNLAGKKIGTGFTGDEDAGVIHFSKLLPQDLWALRVRIGQAISTAAPKPKRKLRDFLTVKRDLKNLIPGYVSVGEVPAVVSSQSAAAKVSKKRTQKVVQGRQFVRDTLIDPQAPDKNVGSQRKDNRVMRRNNCNAFLVRFDLSKLRLAKGSKVEKATVSFFTWDPSSRGNAKVHAFPLKTAWEESTATWKSPSAGKKWKGGDGFDFNADAGAPSKHIIVPPDQGRDTVNPPLEYKIDVTQMVTGWLSGKSPNYGLAIASVIDRSVDEGHMTRFQVYATEHNQQKYTPKLTIEVEE